ncbi:MAG: hypothetical protein V4609_03520 [Pseudomonadota bacterium]
MKLLIAALFAVVLPLAQAKLPPPDAAAQARAQEAAARAAWQAKVDGFQLCKSQDRVVAHYRKTGAAATPATAATAATPCAEPGPFAYTPPEQKPLEAAGAHSPPTTAASPPSGASNSAQIAPGGKKP